MKQAITTGLTSAQDAKIHEIETYLLDQGFRRYQNPPIAPLEGDYVDPMYRDTETKREHARITAWDDGTVSYSIK